MKPVASAAGEPVEPELIPSSLWAAHSVMATLVRLGVKDVIYCPGSRSAPFVPVLDAAARAGLIQTRVVLDERSAGFIALGAARAHLATGRRRGAAVITTSGTAVANLHPAVAEADAAGIPLLVISTDRPQEMVGTGANQTTEQTGMFGRALRGFVDLSSDMYANLGTKAARQVIAGQVRRGLAWACGQLTNDPGPVQINLRLRPPLAPAEPLTAETEFQFAAPAPVLQPSTETFKALPAVSTSAVAAQATRGVVIAGDSVDNLGVCARYLAEYLHWPLFAEPTSGARAGAQALTRYAQLLETSAGENLAAQITHVVVSGHPTLSRPISALLARRDLNIDVITATARWTDVAGTANRVILLQGGGTEVKGTKLADYLALPPALPDWFARWQQAVADLPAPAQLAAPPSARLTSAQALMQVWDSCTQTQGGEAPQLLIGSSMSVRLLDYFAKPVLGAAHPLTNRGLAGIDGTIATAVGLWQARRQSVRLVLGDLSFLHDAMSLGRGSGEATPAVQVVVIDNSGGDIFSTLEYPATTTAAVMERYFTTAQSAQLPALAQALGANVFCATTGAQLQEVLDQPIQGLSVVYVAVQPRK